MTSHACATAATVEHQRILLAPGSLRQQQQEQQ